MANSDADLDKSCCYNDFGKFMFSVFTVWVLECTMGNLFDCTCYMRLSFFFFISDHAILSYIFNKNLILLNYLKEIDITIKVTTRTYVK